jgi:phage terminase large subunit
MTIRKPGSEIDDTYQRFVVNPPPNAVVVKTSFRDNPALSEELRLEISTLSRYDICSESSGGCHSAWE